MAQAAYTGPGPTRGVLSLDLAQEAFQRAYVRSIAAAARCTLSEAVPDFDGVDMTIHQQALTGGEAYFSGLDLQLKSTRVAETLKDNHIALSLSKKHYDKLRTPNVATPRLLVVILVPPNIEDWLDQDEERLQLMKCAYWLSLRGEGPIETDSITVHVPRSNLFNVEALCKLLYRSRAGLEMGA